MKTLVVYESSFGNTRAIAEAVFDGVEEGGGEVWLIEAANAPAALPPDVELVIIGAPTHNMGLPTSASRAKAARPVQLLKRGLVPRLVSANGSRRFSQALMSASQPSTRQSVRG